MTALRFTLGIAAPCDRAWDRMLGDAGYRVWTAAFAEGSHFEGTWQTGARIRFLGPNGQGITSVIAACRPPSFVAIRHLGMVADGVEDTESEAVRSWAPALETYTFTPTAGGCELQVELEVPTAWEVAMRDAWPKALAALKALCEGTPA